MSDHHNETDTGPIKSSKHILIAFFFVFVVPATLIIGLGSGLTALNAPTKADQQAVAERIQKVGSVALAAQDSAGGAPKTGEQVYTTVCANCHGSGAMNSPKFGDAGAWGPRIAKGYNALLDSALHGKGQMPARGGSALSDLEIARGLVYMANKGGAHFPEPKDTAEGKK
jgi:cytochrome c5